LFVEHLLLEIQRFVVEPDDLEDRVVGRTNVPFGFFDSIV